VISDNRRRHSTTHGNDNQNLKLSSIAVMLTKNIHIVTSCISKSRTVYGHVFDQKSADKSFLQVKGNNANNASIMLTWAYNKTGRSMQEQGSHTCHNINFPDFSRFLMFDICNARFKVFAHKMSNPIFSFAVTVSLFECIQLSAPCLT
jgi:hypothetical protein